MDTGRSKGRHRRRRQSIIGIGILLAVILIITAIALGVISMSNTSSNSEEQASSREFKGSQEVIQHKTTTKKETKVSTTTSDITEPQSVENDNEKVATTSSTNKYSITKSKVNEVTKKSNIHTGNRILVMPTPAVGTLDTITTQIATLHERNGATATTSTEYEGTIDVTTTTHKSKVDKKILQIEDDDVTTKHDVTTITTTADPKNAILSILFEIIKENVKKETRITAAQSTTEDMHIYKRPHGKKECSEVCNDITEGKIPDNPKGFATSGSSAQLYSTFTGINGMKVYCDCTYGSTNAWTVFQRRIDGSTNFQRNWNDYVTGFGDVTQEFWLGLETISKITNAGGEYELRIDMMDWDGRRGYAEYRTFSVDTAANKYALHIQNYAGNAGDSLSDHNGKSFSTYDADNDGWNEFNMAQMLKSGWWFGQRGGTNLNGIYHIALYEAPEADGILWYKWKRNSFYSLKETELKFRKIT